jgi:Protein of unknown function (DUF1566)
MRRGSFRRLVFAAGGVVVASVARADAPGYGTGNSQYGAFDSSNTTITDSNTGLTWQRAAPSALVSFTGAQDYCAGIALGGWSTGWRVPSYKELLTIVDESPHAEYDGTTNVYKAIDSHAFGFLYTPITIPWYWSSSSWGGPGGGFLVNFETGATKTDDGGFLVRCVHDP